MVKNNIVILGAGYGGIRATQRLSDLLKEQNNYQIVLINKHNFHAFMTLLHESAAGTSDFDDINIPIGEILEGQNVNFIKGWVDQIDLSGHSVTINHSETKIDFKYLIVALGSEPEYFNIEGLKENSVSLRSLYSAMEIHRKIENLLHQASLEKDKKKRQELLTFVVGGGGLTGVEFAGELAHQLLNAQSKYQLDHDYKIIMVEAAPGLLPGLANELGEYSKQTLEQLGVEVLTGDLVAKVTPQVINLKSGREISYSLFLWAGGVRGNKVLAQSGWQTERGRVPVNEYLQYVNDPYVYIVGDSALAKDPKNNKPVLPTAQAALQQGELAAYNVYADISGQDKKIYYPGSIGSIISIGRGRGLGEIKNFRFKGTPAFWVKELIPLKYRYSLGGFKMLTKSLLGHAKKPQKI